MGRYGGPDFEKEGVVSIWVATVPLSEIPDDYFEENYGGEDDEPFNAFSEDFGFGFYDHDFVDTNGSDDGPRTVEELLAPCSFSASYLSEAAAEAKRRGLDTTEYIILMYKFDYQPKVTGKTRSAFMEFLGSFRYDSGAPSAAEIPL